MVRTAKERRGGDVMRMSSRPLRFVAFGAALVALLTSGVDHAGAQAPRSPTPASIAAPVRVVTVASGLEHPWGLTFLPDGRMLVTERPGRLRIADRDGKLSAPLGGVP